MKSICTTNLDKILVVLVLRTTSVTKKKIRRDQKGGTCEPAFILLRPLSRTPRETFLVPCVWISKSCCQTAKIPIGFSY